MTSQQKVLYTLHQSLGDFLKVAQSVIISHALTSLSCIVGTK